MSYFGPKFGEQAEAVIDELETLLEQDSAAFRADEVEVEIDGNTITIPTEKCGFSVEEHVIRGEHVRPHIVEPSFGVNRIVSTVLAHSYAEDEVDGEERVYLELPPEVAPNLVGIFPLFDDLEPRAKELTSRLGSQRDLGFVR